MIGNYRRNPNPLNRYMVITKYVDCESRNIFQRWTVIDSFKKMRAFFQSDRSIKSFCCLTGSEIMKVNKS